VAIDSPSRDEAAIGYELERRFEALGCAVRRDSIGNLVAVLPGRSEGTILLSTHMDTVGSDRGVVPSAAMTGSSAPTGRRSWEPMTNRGSPGASGS
jgi:tripeptide aminopeptidase